MFFVLRMFDEITVVNHEGLKHECKYSECLFAAVLQETLWQAVESLGCWHTIWRQEAMFWIAFMICIHFACYQLDSVNLYRVTVSYISQDEDSATVAFLQVVLCRTWVWNCRGRNLSRSILSYSFSSSSFFSVRLSASHCVGIRFSELFTQLFDTFFL